MPVFRVLKDFPRQAHVLLRPTRMYPLTRHGVCLTRITESLHACAAAQNRLQYKCKFPTRGCALSSAAIEFRTGTCNFLRVSKVHERDGMSVRLMPV
jgi:hypothetical protein